MPQNLSRRQFLATSAVAGAALPAFLRAAEPKDDPVAFFLVGDTHFLANKEDTAKLDERSAAVTSRLVDQLNKLPGTDDSLNGRRRKSTRTPWRDPCRGLHRYGR